jgi:UDP-N-acetylmuramoylalanine--D-glutamate ligase
LDYIAYSSTGGFSDPQIEVNNAVQALAIVNQYANKNIALIGYGVTGKACANYLLDKGAKVSVFDQHTHNQAAEDAQGLRFYSLNENTRLHDFETVVVSPGVNLQQRFIQDYLLHANKANKTPEVIGDIELFARELASMRLQNPSLNTKVIGVTGSNGKSTVVDLLSQCLSSLGLKVGLGGNFGTSALLMLSQNYDVIVLELSSFQLESTHSLDLDVACVLNVTPDHIDRHGSLLAYAEAKRRIYRHAANCIFNRDDPQTFVPDILETDESIAKTLVSFGQSEATNRPEVQIHQNADALYLRIREQEYSLMCFGETQLEKYQVSNHAFTNFTAHQKLNIQVVLAACYLILGDDLINAQDNADAQQIRNKLIQTIVDYRGLAHRFSIIKDDESGMWVNDSKATNAGASIAAIESLVAQGKRIILIAGGDAKEADLSTWYDCVNQHVSHTLLIGKDADTMSQHVHKNERVNSLGDAVSHAQIMLQKLSNAAVLLSPACASIDMFDNYQQRGDVFTQLVIEKVAA